MTPFVLTGLLIGALGVAPPPPDPVVPGSVRSGGGAPVEGVLVTARDSARGLTTLVVSDAGGGFALPRRAAGPMLITASTPDGRLMATARLSGDGRSLDLVLRAAGTPARRASSAGWLAALPAGESRRRFILDCTGCHQFDDSRALKDGKPRTAAQFAEDIRRMLGYAGPQSSFPVISAWAERPDAAPWIASAVANAEPATAAIRYATDAVLTEFDLPVAQDLPHDLAVDGNGRVVITGMLSHQMYVLDPTSGRVETVSIPVARANPRAVEIDRTGHWWVLLGAPGKIGRYAPDQARWQLIDIGMYPHSIAVASDDEVWFNGHFSRDPEQVGRARASTGQVDRFDLPPHPALRTAPGGPIPYEERLGPDGRLWVSELQGNRIIAFDPSTREGRAFTLPTSWSGPRRFDLGPDGTVWIPGYAANTLVELDPATGRMTEIPLPIAGATPYVVRVSRKSGAVWIGTGAADAVLRYDPATGAFATYPLASQGALIRHLVVDDERDEVWLAYGASPGRIPARVARLALQR